MRFISKYLILAGIIFGISATHSFSASYVETPTLEHRVSTGDLPPVEERLPENPSVVELGQPDGVGEDREAAGGFKGSG